MRPETFVLLFLALLGQAGAKHFQSWYRVYGPVFDNILHSDCQDKYEAYMTQEPEADCRECLAERTIACILDETPGDFKANMAAASVLLGLLPSILSLAGSKAIETGLLAQRRPFLSFLTSLGAPAAWPIHSFDYHSSPAELFRETPGAVDLPELTPRWRVVVVITQYLLLIGAFANLLQTTLELSEKTICTFTPSTEYLPLVWALTGVPVHFVGSWASYLRTRVTTEERDTIWGHFDEFRLCMYHKPARVELMKESYWFIWWAWFLSFGTILHIIFGTLMFSSILFISSDYALRVAGRYLASTIVCRAVLMFELAGMRRVATMDMKVASGNPGHSQEQQRDLELQPLAFNGA